MKYLYTIVGLAAKTLPNYMTQNTASTKLITASNNQEALGIAIEFAKTSFPESERWHSHSGGISIVPFDQLAELLKEIA